MGGTAAALHLASLESAAGWQTNRVQRPVLILGQLDGVLTGIRQLRRLAPLETEVVQGLIVPTLAEMARIKAWLLATRHTVRDYLDLVVLLERLGEQRALDALLSFDDLYKQPGGVSPLSKVAERLAQARPRTMRISTSVPIEGCPLPGPIGRIFRTEAGRGRFSWRA